MMTSKEFTAAMDRARQQLTDAMLAAQRALDFAQFAADKGLRPSEILVDEAMEVRLTYGNDEFYGTFRVGCLHGSCVAQVDPIDGDYMTFSDFLPHELQAAFELLGGTDE